MMNFMKGNITLAHIVGLVCLNITPSCKDNATRPVEIKASTGDSIYHVPVDWTSIRRKDVPRNVSIDGYISLDGVGEYPTITLWENPEAMQQGRLFYCIHIDSVSMANLVAEILGRDSKEWHSLKGAFVVISGNLVPEKVNPNLGLGELSDIRQVRIKCNGDEVMVISNLKRPLQKLDKE
jgi:hypothetical protein